MSADEFAPAARFEMSLAKARRIEREAITSEFTAEINKAIADAIEKADLSMFPTDLVDEIRGSLLTQLDYKIDEFYADADNARGEIPVELIDYL